MMEIISLTSALKTYRMGDEVVYALNSTDLTITPGSFMAIEGASGSGKSTLMHVMGLMDQLTEGNMIFEGEEVTGIPHRQRATLRSRRIGFVFQNFNLLPKLTVLQNVLLPTQYLRQREKPGQADAIKQLERVGMEHRAKHKPSQLSGGERQRTAIARALINQPALILADEPTGNLDSENVQNILQLFAELHEEGQTIALVTHDPEVASKAKQRIYMKDGRIINRNQSVMTTQE